MIFQWIQNLWLRLSGQENDLQVIAKQNQRMEALQNALIQLVFQRKQTESQLTRASAQLQEIEEDLKLSVQEDRDDLSIHLMQKHEQVTAEVKFLSKHLEKIREDIEAAKKTQVDLKHSIETSRRKHAVLIHQREVLQARRSIQKHLAPVASGEDLSARIAKIEAENEILDQSNPLDEELRKIREKRTEGSYLKKLSALKAKLNPTSLNAPTDRLVKTVGEVR